MTLLGWILLLLSWVYAMYCRYQWWAYETGMVILAKMYGDIKTHEDCEKLARKMKDEYIRTKRTNN